MHERFLLLSIHYNRKEGDAAGTHAGEWGNLEGADWKLSSDCLYCLREKAAK